RRDAEDLGQPGRPVVGVDADAGERLDAALVRVDVRPVAQDEHFEARDLHGAFLPRHTFERISGSCGGWRASTEGGPSEGIGRATIYLTQLAGSREVRPRTGREGVSLTSDPA